MTELILIIFLIPMIGLIFFKLPKSFISKNSNDDTLKVKVPLEQQDNSRSFIEVSKLPTRTGYLDGQSRKELSALKYKIKMFQLRNQFYDIENR